MIAACANTVRLGALQDKSASATPNGVYQMRPDDFRAPAELIVRCGGEIGIGVVGIPSGDPLHRWAVAAPEPSPRPAKADDTPINAAIDAAAYEERLAEWNRKNDERVKRARLEFDDFMGKVTPLLSQKADHGKTPLWLALARVDAFLAEPDSSSTTSSRYLVLSSDGINTSGKPIPLTSGATLFISNGSQAVGSLDKLMFTVVESPVGAFRKIIDLENTNANRAQSF
ncbi:MAG: hypothetical protein WC815_20155 [Vicinamibacterales bacterium]